MSDDWLNYVNDPRTICKYGIKCYQKNTEHAKKFKHPPQRKRKQDAHNHNIKRLKIPTDDVEDLDLEKKTQESMSQCTEDKIPSSSNYVTTKINSSKQDEIELPKKISYYEKKVDKNLIKELFLFEMPSDFYKFYECLLTEQCLEKTLANVNLELIGPYDLFLGKLPVVHKDLYLIHWRFFYDPPEFQAVLKSKGKSQYHIGYYRDTPDEAPVFLAHNDSAKDCHITPMATNIFGAVYLYLQNEKKKSPFTSIACQKLMDKVKKWAEDNNFSVEEYSMKKRQSQIVTKTFHGAGIVVPFNKKSQVGYRKLVESDAAIKKYFARLGSVTTQLEKDKILSELQPVITYANIAVDECDFGTGLEIGINLFCSGLKDLEPIAISSLCSAYKLLKREAFVKIIQAHIKYRRQGPDMSLVTQN